MLSEESEAIARMKEVLAREKDHDRNATYVATVMLGVADVGRVLGELARLQRQVADLHAAGTKLLQESRRRDRVHRTLADPDLHLAYDRNYQGGYGTVREIEVFRHGMWTALNGVRATVTAPPEEDS